MRRCHPGLDPAPPPAPRRAFPLFFVLEPGPNVLPAGRALSLRTNSRAADTNSLYSECWEDSTVQRKLSGDMLNRKKVLPPPHQRTQDARCGRCPGTHIPAHPSMLQGEPLGPAPAGAIPAALRARRGEEGPATLRRFAGPVPAQTAGHSLGGSALPSQCCRTTEEQMSSSLLLSGVQKYPKTRVICISFVHLENLIPLLDACHNAVLPEP